MWNRPSCSLVSLSACALTVALVAAACTGRRPARPGGETGAVDGGSEPPASSTDGGTSSAGEDASVPRPADGGARSEDAGSSADDDAGPEPPIDAGGPDAEDAGTPGAEDAGRPDRDPCATDTARAASTAGCNGGFRSGSIPRNQTGGACSVGSCSRERATCEELVSGGRECLEACVPADTYVSTSTCPRGFRCFTLSASDAYCFRDCDASNPCGPGEVCDGEGSCVGDDSSPSDPTDPPDLGGNTCASPIPLDLGTGAVTVRGSTRGATDFRALSCTTSGPDRVYEITVEDPSRTLLATVTPLDDFQPAVMISDGGSCAGSGEGRCSVARSVGSAVTAVEVVGPGTYYVWVDGTASGGTGDYELRVKLSGPAGDACDEPTPLIFDSGIALVSGTTSDSASDHAGSCAESTGPDNVYSFEAEAGQSFFAYAYGLGYGGVLTLTGPGDCGTATELRCNAGTDAAAYGVSATLGRAGTYYLWVDGNAASRGSYRVSAFLTGGDAPTEEGDRCSDAIPLTFNPDERSYANRRNAVTRVSGDVTGAGNHYRSPTCGGGRYERVYTFTTDASRRVEIALGGTGIHGATLALHGPAPRFTCSRSPEVACADRGPYRILRDIDPGTYFIYVDLLYETTPYTLDVRFTR